MTRFIDLPSLAAATRLVRPATKLAIYTLPVLLLTHEAFAQANTLGNRLTAASSVAGSPHNLNSPLLPLRV